MGRDIKIDLPLYIVNGRNKKYWLTMNNYRNWHYQINNNLKKKFKLSLMPHLGFRFSNQVHIHYRLFAPDRRKRDLMNNVSVIDKFFQDALVELGCIQEDNVSIVVKITAEYIGIDKDNPRLEAIITDL